MEREYKDIDGHPVSLDTLCRNEPAWAVNSIRRLEAECERLREGRSRVAELEAQLEWVCDDYEAERARTETRPPLSVGSARRVMAGEKVPHRDEQTRKHLAKLFSPDATDREAIGGECKEHGRHTTPRCPHCVADELDDAGMP